jgi:hypothetical protein
MEFELLFSQLLQEVKEYFAQVYVFVINRYRYMVNIVLYIKNNVDYIIRNKIQVIVKHDLVDRSLILKEIIQFLRQIKYYSNTHY